MRERPILFKSAMVNAILEGRKTQTRRIIKGDYDGCEFYESKDGDLIPVLEVSPFQIGMHLWVKETFFKCPEGYEDAGIVYKADGKTMPFPHNWKPSLFMPRVASRITLEITNARIERLNDISEEDAIAEGCKKWMEGGKETDTAKNDYAQLWNSINGEGSWALNPWVFVISFKKLED